MIARSHLLLMEGSRMAHDRKPRPGATHRKKRVGRGISAGQGKTAGRGTKGEGARSGSGGHMYRQGGNLPFFRRLPFAASATFGA
jgi:large subunit ribosomal protein L15